jgi:hypothetical protein
VPGGRRRVPCTLPKLTVVSAHPSSASNNSAAAGVLNRQSILRLEPEAFRPLSMGHPIDHIVDAQFVGLVGLVDWTQPDGGPLPEL